MTTGMGVFLGCMWIAFGLFWLGSDIRVGCERIANMTWKVDIDRVERIVRKDAGVKL